MTGEPHITIAQLAEICKVSTRAVQNNINALKQAGLLRREGSAKGGNWQVCSTSSHNEETS